MTANRILIAVAAGLAILAFLYFKGCKSEPETTEPSKPEQVRVKSETANVKERIIYVTNDARLIAENKALREALAAKEGKDKQATDKAAQSAQEFEKTPTLDNCKLALHDCKEENGTKAAVITVLKQQVGTVTEQRKADSAEINRLVLRSDTLNAGWKQANADLEAVLNRKPLQVFATIAAEQHPLNGNAKIGATATYGRLLIGYQKGLIQNTHEITAGWKIRLKKR